MIHLPGVNRNMMFLLVIMLFDMSFAMENECANQQPIKTGCLCDPYYTKETKYIKSVCVPKKWWEEMKKKDPIPRLTYPTKRSVGTYDETESDIDDSNDSDTEPQITTFAIETLTGTIMEDIFDMPINSEDLKVLAKGYGNPPSGQSAYYYDIVKLFPQRTDLAHLGVKVFKTQLLKSYTRMSKDTLKKFIRYIVDEFTISILLNLKENNLFVKSYKLVVQEVGLGHPLIYIVMEKCDYTLKDLIIKRALTNDERQQLWDTLQKVNQKLEQLQISHNDIKPANIYIQEKDGVIFKIGDFGLSQFNGHRYGGVKGTEGFRPPSQMLNLPTPYHDRWASFISILFAINNTNQNRNNHISDITQKNKNNQYWYGNMNKQIILGTTNQELSPQEYIVAVIEFMKSQCDTTIFKINQKETLQVLNLFEGEIGHFNYRIHMVKKDKNAIQLKDPDNLPQFIAAFEKYLNQHLISKKNTLKNALDYKDSDTSYNTDKDLSETDNPSTKSHYSAPKLTNISNIDVIEYEFISPFKNLFHSISTLSTKTNTPELYDCNEEK